MQSDIIVCMREQGIQNLIRIFMSGIGITNWRNNTGTGWAGKSTKIARSGRYQLEAGDVVVKNARPLRSGLCKGSSDIIGLTPVFITQDMVGKTVGVFTAVEVKGKTGKPTEAQNNFIQIVKRHGGYAGIARNQEDVDQIINRF